MRSGHIHGILLMSCHRMLRKRKRRSVCRVSFSHFQLCLKSEHVKSSLIRWRKLAYIHVISLQNEKPLISAVSKSLQVIGGVLKYGLASDVVVFAKKRLKRLDDGWSTNWPAEPDLSNCSVGIPRTTAANSASESGTNLFITDCFVDATDS